MNKTNYVILTLILCFSVAFIVCPIKTNALSDEAQAMIDDLKEKYPEEEEEEEEFDLFSEFRTDPSDPSGTPGYDIVEEDPSGTEGPLPADVGAIYIPVVEEEEEEEEKEKKKYKYKVCATGAGCAEAGTCVTSSSYQDRPDECQTDADCGGGTPPPVSPPSNGETSPSNGGTSPSNGGTPPSNGWTPPPTSPPPTSPPPTLPETQPCMINYFELPERAWVDYPITGRWSAGAWCDDCDVDCTPYPECVWKQDSIGTGFDEYKFTLSQSEIYNYTLTCYGQGGIDERTETATVEALNLPWWREIIPVLQGFLRGIWG